MIGLTQNLERTRSGTWPATAAAFSQRGRGGPGGARAGYRECGALQWGSGAAERGGGADRQERVALVGYMRVRLVSGSGRQGGGAECSARGERRPETSLRRSARNTLPVALGSKRGRGGEKLNGREWGRLPAAPSAAAAAPVFALSWARVIPAGEPRARPVRDWARGRACCGYRACPLPPERRKRLHSAHCRSASSAHAQCRMSGHGGWTDAAPSQHPSR